VCVCVLVCVCVCVCVCRCEWNGGGALPFDSITSTFIRSSVMLQVRTMKPSVDVGGDTFYTATSLHRISVKDPIRNKFG
jgi:hypothetical protein